MHSHSPPPPTDDGAGQNILSASEDKWFIDCENDGKWVNQSSSMPSDSQYSRAIIWVITVVMVGSRFQNMTSAIMQHHTDEWPKSGSHHRFFRKIGFVQFQYTLKIDISRPFAEGRQFLTTVVNLVCHHSGRLSALA
uniref:Uncharacterized protein n=1 Tax=uncultured marine group II/III euryarchaeote KM3_192_C12 TaxID=1457964 RepID=A0A075GW03_9EURY|nr:hypothetical protein [uncultured marine group II/III euryarchaeote KM3_192_C12]